MNRLSRLAFIALLGASPAIIHAQSVESPATPRVFIASLRVTDSLSRQAAVHLRSALSERVTPTALQVVSTEVFERTKAAAVDRPGGPWDWSGVRNFARQVAAQHIVDIAAVSDSGTVRIVAFVVHPVRTGEPVPLPVFTGRSLDDAVVKLADYLAARSWTSVR